MAQVLLSAHIAEKLQQIAEERGATLMELVEQIVEDYLAQTQYDEASDPAIGLLRGPVDLADNAKAILISEIQNESGWTQKETIG
ncbi:MAG: hypothetical protein M3Q45_06275 [Chloroflexota bacterium]|nr:hypothetical protein [Chloroflexota bacterium]